MIPSKPSPTVVEPKKWSKEMLVFLERCLAKEVNQRADTKELLGVFNNLNLSNIFF